MKVCIKRVYEDASSSDGKRILVDRLWPRGLSKEEAAVDLWLKEIAPSPELRRWFNHDPARWEAFRNRYFAELEANAALEQLKEEIRRGPVCLLYAARDEEHNNALALKAYLEQHAR